MRPLQGLNQPPIQWATEVLSPGEKRLQLEAVHLPPSSAWYKYEWSLPPLPPPLNMSSWSARGILCHSRKVKLMCCLSVCLSVHASLHLRHRWPNRRMYYLLLLLIITGYLKWSSNRTKKFVQKKKLTLILLTWSIWWAPNNASKRQMGFNSAFKGLIVSRQVSSVEFSTNLPDPDNRRSV